MNSGMARAGFLLNVAGVLALAGCGQPPAAEAGKAKEKATEVAKAGHEHGTWWCDEHGVPEDECSMCSAKIAKAMKQKGDWCDKHDRAKSQCFLCDPSLREKYAAKYRAKEGKEPPVPTGQAEQTYTPKK